jgi:hypothetical protein
VVFDQLQLELIEGHCPVVCHSGVLPNGPGIAKKKSKIAKIKYVFLNGSILSLVLLSRLFLLAQPYLFYLGIEIHIIS